jgi:hypothetical protein
MFMTDGRQIAVAACAPDEPEALCGRSVILVRRGPDPARPGADKGREILGNAR